MIGPLIFIHPSEDDEYHFLQCFIGERVLLFVMFVAYLISQINDICRFFLHPKVLTILHLHEFSKLIQKAMDNFFFVAAQMLKTIHKRSCHILASYPSFFAFKHTIVFDTNTIQNLLDFFIKVESSFSLVFFRNLNN